eukprot:NODE_5534_length_642_cov_28.970874_g5370_i0.p1 GENE.NODE_5534_length_642_cov_28.970874_g5370_i0~~NODE_5534_length_642_cov_28.970874_g5370_i0.p1  ORF type:complete len:113 (+),score=29.21 NODE_5534_length_642_cov_28.970874_g5370_i0:219-557(+)
MIDWMHIAEQETKVRAKGTQTNLYLLNDFDSWTNVKMVYACEQQYFDRVSSREVFGAAGLKGGVTTFHISKLDDVASECFRQADGTSIPYLCWCKNTPRLLRAEHTSCTTFH